MTTSNAHPITESFHGSGTSEEGLKRALWYSIALHISLFVIFAVRAALSPPTEILLENAVRVDIVALPDKSPAKLPEIEEPVPAPPATADPAKPEPAPSKPEPVKPPKSEKPKVNLNKAKRDQEAALKRLEALEKIKKINKPDTKTDNSTKVASPQAPLKGNEISKGASLKGISKLEFSSYREAVDGHIKKFWNLPQWLANANLSARVQLFVDANGNIVKKVMTRSSGQPVYDERVMKAIEQASPMPRPPSDLVDFLAINGMELEFVPE